MGSSAAASPRAARFAAVVGRFHPAVTGALLDGALKAFRKAGVPRESVDVYRVPGAFEIPQALRRAARAARYDGLIGLGCILRGETTQYGLLGQEVMRGMLEVARDFDVPVGLGVIVAEDGEQAEARAGGSRGNRGVEAAEAVLEMAVLYRDMGRETGRGKGRAAKRARAGHGGVGNGR